MERETDARRFADGFTTVVCARGRSERWEFERVNLIRFVVVYIYMPAGGL